MKKVIVYSKDYCPFCSRAKDLLRNKEVPFTEIEVNTDEIREKLVAATQRLTVPQIQIGDEYIEGGCDGLYKLEAEGKLDEILKV